MGFPKHYATSAAPISPASSMTMHESASSSRPTNINKRKYADASPSFDPTHAESPTGRHQPHQHARGPAIKAPRRASHSIKLTPPLAVTFAAAGTDGQSIQRLRDESRQPSYDSADGGDEKEALKNLMVRQKNSASPFRPKPAASATTTTSGTAGNVTSGAGSRMFKPTVSRSTSETSSFDKNELASAFALASLSKGASGSFTVGASASFSAGIEGRLSSVEKSSVPSTANKEIHTPPLGSKTTPTERSQGRIVPMYVDQRPDGFLVSPDSHSSPIATHGAPDAANVRTPAETIPALDAHMAQRQEEAQHHGGMPPLTQPQAPHPAPHPSAAQALAAAGQPHPPHYHPYPYPYGYYYGMPPALPPPHPMAGYPAYPPGAYPQPPPVTSAAHHGYPPHPFAPAPPSPTQANTTDKKWACDYCSVSSFGTYEEACAHEAICRNKKPQQGLLKSPGSPPRPNNHVRQVSWYPAVSRDDCPTNPATDGIRRGASSEEEARDDSENGSTEDRQQQSRKAVVAYNPQPVSAEEQRRLDREEEAAREFATKNLPVRPTPLCVSETDPTWLSDLNCYIRQNCVEVFTASEMDINRTSKRGRISLHQVGIRCRFCTHDYEQDVIGKVREAAAAISFPVSVSGIYESVKRWHRVHTKVCKGIPNETKEQLRIMGEKPVYVPTSRGYWTESAKAMGMKDCPTGGIYFHRQPDESVKEYLEKKASDVKDGKGQYGRVAPVLTNSSAYERDIASKKLVLCSDKDEVSPYVFLLMSQVQPTTFTAADRYVARSKGPIGYAGFECKHCAGHAGLGKYFPSSAKGMCTNSTSQNIHSHLIKCRRVPQEVKNELEDFKQGGRGKCNVKLSNGWRRKFFDTVWERLHESNDKD